MQQQGECALIVKNLFEPVYGGGALNGCNRIRLQVDKVCVCVCVWSEGGKRFFLILIDWMNKSSSAHVKLFHGADWLENINTTGFN